MRVWIVVALMFFWGPFYSWATSSDASSAAMFGAEAATSMADAAQSLNTDFNIDVTFYHLGITVHPTTSTISGSTYIELLPTIMNLSEVKLNLHNSMTVTAVSEDAVSWTRLSNSTNTIVIILNREYNPTETVKLRVDYNGAPVSPPGTVKGFRFFPNGNNLPMAVTLSTPYVAHYWFPCKDGPTDKADKVYVDITTPTTYGGQTMTGLSNGVLKETVTSGQNTTFKWQHHHACVPFYVMVAVGRYDTINQTYNRNGHNFPLEYFVFPGQTADATVGTSIMPAAFDAFIHYFGDYPFKDEQYGMTQIGFFGGIENQTNSVMWSLSSSWRNTMVHELAHMWFGCSVSCSNWHHIWINEGFATYAEALYYEYTSGPAAYLSHIESMRFLTGGSIFLADDSNPANVFSTNNYISYDKGAWVLHMLRWELGDEVFFNCLKTFAQDPRYRFKNASTEDFKALCEELSGRNLYNFFDQWIYDIYHPYYKYNFYSDVAAGKTGLTLYQYQQDRWGERAFFDVLMQIRFTFDDGTSTIETVRNNQKWQTFYFDFTKNVTSITLDPNSKVLLHLGSSGGVFYNSHDLSIVVPPAPSNTKEIAGFNIPGQVGATAINHAARTVSVSMPYGANLSSLVPVVSVSSGAMVSPVSGQTVDFSSPVPYTVTADNGTSHVYTVTVSNAPNSQKRIETFTIPGQVGATEIDHLAKVVVVTMPVGTVVNALTPTVTVSGSATISPASGVTRNFSATQNYTVTAQNSTTQVYAVKVNVIPAPNLAGNDLELCEGETSTYSTLAREGNQYRWTVVGGTLLTDNASEWRSVSMGGNSISVRWDDPANGSITVEERVAASYNSSTNQSAVVVYEAIEQKTPSATTTTIYEGEAIEIRIPNSQSGVSYQLRNVSAGTNTGSPMVGTGTELSLLSGGLSYASDGVVIGVQASNNGCSLPMPTSVSLSFYPHLAWSGALNNNWNNHQNWLRGVVPSVLDDVFVKLTPNRPEVSGLARANDLVIKSGASLMLLPGAHMTVNGNITNTGASIVLKNTVDLPTSFLTSGTLSGPVTYEWVYPTGKYIYLGHCVDGNLYGNYNSPANSLVYKIVNNAWVQVTNSTGFNANALDGYSVGFKAALGPTTTVLHSGTLRQGNYTYGLGANWYLIGNPYATYLDLESSGFEIGADFKTVYVANMGTGSATYATYNIATNVGANAGSRYIAPGQSFWVRNYTGTPTLSINSSARTHATGALKAASIVDDVLRLQVSKGSATDEGVLVFRDFGSESFSGVYDSEKRFATGPAEMSIYTQKDNRKLVINALPDVLDGRTVPLFLNIGTANGGTFTLSATNLGEFMADVEVYLLDKTTGETTNLRDKSSYTFTSAAVSAQNRFELSFAPKVKVPEVPTEVGNTLGDGARITAIGLDNKAIVKVKDASFNGNVTIEVLDALGKLHGRTVSQTARTEVSAPSNTQFFVVKVTYNNRVETFKIVTKMD